MPSSPCTQCPDVVGKGLVAPPASAIYPRLARRRGGRLTRARTFPTTSVLAEKSIRVASRGWLVRMMQPAQDWHGAHATGPYGATCTSLSGIGHPLPQALMWAPRVEVRGVLREDASQVDLAQDQQVVQALAPHAAKEPLADRILPGRAIRRPQLLDASDRGDAGEGRPVLAVVVVQQVAWPMAERRRLAQLVGDAGVRRVAGHADMHDAARRELNHEERVERPEEQGSDRE